MKTGIRKLRRAFTLLELTVVILIGMMVGTMIIAIFNQQMAFLRIYRIQSFVTEEAPMISVYVNRLVGKADRFRLHASVEDALTGTNPRLTSSPVCVLNYRQPDGTMRASILAFEDTADGPELNYYVVPESGILSAPEWSITDQAQNIEFAVEQGILRTRLTGPQGEQLTYSGATQ
ncbi:MAG: hypothetical protein R3242_02890 [Akkermansiaceae bacterium]|nr:hypothetical protein [Akkermansiaceae bacterium]